MLADVDGALVTQDKELTPKAVAAARSLRAADVSFAITSGRPPRGMKMLIHPLALDTAVAGFNGGVIVRPDLSVIETHKLDPNVARESVELALEGGLDAWVYTPDEWYIRDKDAPHVAREAWTVKFEAKVVESFPDEVFANCVKVVGVSDDYDKVAKAEADARSRLGARATAARSQPYYLDVTHPKANKGEIVLTLCRLMGLSPKEVATMGDMPNDVLMFEKSGLSIAMGNASDEVKAKASEVTASNEEDGFALAVERFVLPRAPKA